MRVLKKVAIGAGILLLAIAALLGVFELLWISEADRAPESATGRRDVALVRTSTTMVVTANPLATKAGLEILEAGGNAIDAAVAVQAVLTLVEPQSSGIGGGAFLLHYDGQRHQLEAFDGRETAPAEAPPSLFMHDAGDPYNFIEAVVGGRAVGVPGALRALELAQRSHGQLPWARLFEPAIALAEQGFEVTPRLFQLLSKDPMLPTMPAARAYFYQDDGRPKAIGTRLVNPELAEVLRAIAQGGADALYRGPIAKDIVAAVRSAERPSMLEVGINQAMLQMGAPYTAGFDADEPNPGLLSEQDLAGYQAKIREPLCRPYRTWRVCGFPPPTSGGITVLEVLSLLERFDLGARTQPDSPEALHLIAEAEKLAYADRDRYIADTDFVPVPVDGLLDPEYLEARSEMIDPKKARKAAKAGLPEGIKSAFVDGVSPELPSTSHFSIVDSHQNVVSMTTSIEFVFGSHVMVHGFLLNNQLTDFSFLPGTEKRPIANAVAANKRPRSSMAPLIVFDQKSGQPVLAIGSPGGSRIIAYVVRATLGILEWGLDPQRAVSLPHVVNRNGATELENDGWDPGELDAAKKALTALGHTVEVGEQNSGLHAISITEHGLLGGVDPRREGLAAGW